MRQFDRYFTLEEARELLPPLRLLFKRIHAARERAQELDFELGRRVQQMGGDLGGAKPLALIGALNELQSGLSELQQTGVQVKDLDRGLVDFPHLREGREVLLCWELGEDDIEYWHDLDSGYTGREKL